MELVNKLVIETYFKVTLCLMKYQHFPKSVKQLVTSKLQG